MYKILKTICLFAGVLISGIASAQSLSYTSSSYSFCGGAQSTVRSASTSYYIPIPSGFPSSYSWAINLYPTGPAISSANGTLTAFQTGVSALSGNANVSFTVYNSGNMGLSATLLYRTSPGSSPTVYTTYSYSNLAYLNYANPNTSSNVGFSLNGASSTSNPATAVTAWLCNASTTFSLAPRAASISGYQILVEKGNGPGFTPTSSVTSPLYATTTLPGTIDLSSLFGSYLPGYTGYLRVTLFVNGSSVCGGGTFSASQVYNVQNATAAVNFVMKQSACTGAINPTYTIPNLPGQPLATAPNCATGWITAGSGGISGINIPSSTGVSSSSVTVEEVDPSNGNPIFVVGSQNFPGLPSSPSYDFTTILSGYFILNYNTIKNNRVYKVTVSANTPGCGAVSKASFFKIVDGGAAGQFWRQVSPEGHELMGQGEINVYPNPSTGLFTIYFGKAVENATVIIQSMDGRIISNQTVSDEKIELNITNAPAGLYLIKIIDGAHTSIQKLVKQ